MPYFHPCREWVWKFHPSSEGLQNHWANEWPQSYPVLVCMLLWRLWVLTHDLTSNQSAEILTRDGYVIKTLSYTKNKHATTHNLGMVNSQTNPVCPTHSEPFSKLPILFVSLILFAHRFTLLCLVSSFGFSNHFFCSQCCPLFLSFPRRVHSMSHTAFMFLILA